MIGAVFSKTSTVVGLESIPLVHDVKFNQNNNLFRVPQHNTKIKMIYVIGEQVKECQIVTPSLRKYLSPYVSPLDKSATPSNLFPIPSFMNGLELVAGESLDIKVSAFTNASKIKCIAVWFNSGESETVSGENMRTIKASATFAYNKNAWSNGQIDLSDELEYGMYMIIGARIIANNGLFARFILSPDVDRHLLPCVPSYDKFGNQMFRNGNSGSMGVFNSQEPPKLELIGNASGSNPEIELDIIKVS